MLTFLLARFSPRLFFLDPVPLSKHLESSSFQCSLLFFYSLILLQFSPRGLQKRKKKKMFMITLSHFFFFPARICYANEMQELDRPPDHLLGSIPADFPAQCRIECCRASVGCLVRLDAERCPRYWYHVLRDARVCLLRPFPPLDFHRQHGYLQELQDSRREYQSLWKSLFLDSNKL